MRRKKQEETPDLLKRKTRRAIIKEQTFFLTSVSVIKEDESPVSLCFGKESILRGIQLTSREDLLPTGQIGWNAGGFSAGKK